MDFNREIVYGCCSGVFGSHPDKFVQTGYKKDKSIDERLKAIAQVEDLKAVDLSGVHFQDELDDIGSNLKDMRKESQAPQRRVRKSIKRKKTEFNPWALPARVGLCRPGGLHG